MEADATPVSADRIGARAGYASGSMRPTTAILEAPWTSTSRLRTSVLGVHVSAVNMLKAVQQVESWIDRREHNYICITGVHGVMESQRRPAAQADSQRRRHGHARRHADGLDQPPPRQWACLARVPAGISCSTSAPD